MSTDTCEVNETLRHCYNFKHTQKTKPWHNDFYLLDVVIKLNESSESVRCYLVYNPLWILASDFICL